MRRTLLLLTVVSLVLAAGVQAQEEPAIDPFAAQVLKEMSAYLSSLDHFTFRGEVAEDVRLDNGQLVEIGRAVDFAVRRPDRMFVEVSDNVHRRFVFDGSRLTLMDYTFNTYAQVSMPGTIDDALTTLADRYDVVIPLADLALSDLYDKLIGDIVTGSYLGLQIVDSVGYHHLAFQQQAIDWQVWVRSGPHPLPSRLVIIYKSEAGSPRFTASLSEWDTAAPLPDETFRFEAPIGAQRIELLPVDGSR